MTPDALKRLKRRIVLVFPSAFILLWAMLFLPAGSLRYWHGWVFCAELAACALMVVAYLLAHSPELLERRLRFRERETRQRAIVKIFSVFYFFGFLIPGFDYRFGWSAVPLWLAVLSHAIMLAGYFLVFLSFKENPFAARTVEVFPDQRVIDTGPYAVVRHPMYAGIIPMFLFTPLALGSFWAVIPFLPVCAAIILRLLNEEDVLRRDLPGYRDYCKKVRYRLVPFLW